MTILPGRRARPLDLPPALAVEPPKSPWGQGDGPSDDGPRNPWAVPQAGRKGGQRPTALDEFLKKARGGDGGGSGNGGGFGGGLPGGTSARGLWLIGAGIILLVWILWTSIHPIAPQQRGVV
ncbi:hypothetical protein ACTGXQ_13035, partial [Streptococcus suis]